MILNDVKIYFEGLEMNHDYDEKIRQLVDAIKLLSPTPDISIRFLKSRNIYEGLLWGRAGDIPIGFYHRGHSIAQVLESLNKKVKKECLLKLWKMKGAEMKSRQKPQFQKQPPMAMAG